ncbi:GPW/gp25 family protein [Sphingosinicella sp. CPCC 101087]|uniref:GPW/gp25 family protein n=1 Tax=Sphingosinicella sp. CPCC 101087 TaxID=2497754 RepID=UPI00101D657F|nr:GPW/gp25 family protein [Sphingosinicella sp. CPCC 101087]
MTEVGYPYRFDGRGRTAGAADRAAHVRELIEQLLFTAPGERVMRPDFGTGLMALLFGPASTNLAAATQMIVQSALQQWLSDEIEPQEVSVLAGEGSIEVTVRYVLRETGEARVDSFSRSVAT